MYNLNSVVKFIIEAVKNNKKIFRKLNEEDNEVNYFEFNADKLVQIIQEFKNRDIQEKPKQKILVNHYGNPYITALICMEAVIHNVDVVVGIEDYCYGLNMAIIKIINKALEEKKVSLNFALYNNIKQSEIKKIGIDKVICLGNSNSYMQLRKLKDMEVSNMPLFDLVLYYDSEQYEELARNIKNIANQNFYEIEIFNDTDEFDDVIYTAQNSGRKYCGVILSQDDEKCKRFKELGNFEFVCVNENPFKYFKLKLPENIF